MTFEKFWDENSHRILKYCYHLTKNRDDAEDLRSDVYLKAKRGFDTIQIPGARTTWLFKIAKHSWIDRMNLHSSKNVSLEFIGEYEGRSHINTSAIHEAIDVGRKLRPKHRRIIGLRYLGYTDTEGAKMLGISEGSYKSALARAMRDAKPRSKIR